MSTPDLNAILQSATAELQAGNLDAGETLLQKCLALDPNFAPALDVAARVALLRGQPDLALSHAQRAVSQKSLAPFVVTLAEAMKATNKPNEALQLFAKVLEKDPKDLRSLMGAGDLYELGGHIQLAIQTYATALAAHPGHIEAAIRYSRLLPIEDLPKGLDALNSVKPPPSAPVKLRLGFLEHYVIYKEWAERARRGLMPYHISNLDEAFFNFAAKDRAEYEAASDEILSQNPQHKAGLISKASSLFTGGKRVESEKFYRAAAEHKPDTIYEAIEFSPAFYERIEKMADADLVAGLPPVTTLVAAEFAQAPIIYLSCNYDYFADFGRPMVLSIDAVSEAAQVHLHIMDTPDDIEAVLQSFRKLLKKTKLAVTCEVTGVVSRGVTAARCYYHAIRFIRLYDHLKHYRRPLWLMDVDAILNRDPAPMFSGMGAADVAFRGRPGRWEPWNQHNASVLAIAPTSPGFEYLRLVSAYIADYYKNDRLRWGIDQLAMYGVHEFLKDNGRAPKVHLLDDRAVDYEAHDDGFVWCNSGKAKFQQLQRLKKGKADAQDASKLKYLTKFKTYLSQL